MGFSKMEFQNWQGEIEGEEEGSGFLFLPKMEKRGNSFFFHSQTSF